MAKSLIGIDIGYDTLKLVLLSGKRVRRAVVVPMPKNLIKEGRVVSPETLGELIRTTLRQNRMSARRAALALSDEIAYVRTVVMPRMTAEQLSYNLPFEFRDYITEELKDYKFDYSMITVEEKERKGFGKHAEPEPEPEPESDLENGEEDSSNSMELLAATVRNDVLDEMRAVVRKAGMKLVSASPVVCGYISLIRNMDQSFRPESHEYCILDLGYRNIRMYMFNGDRHIVTRQLDIGLLSLDSVIAESLSVDVHLAHTYLMTNYNDCQHSENCQNAYGNIALELMRALNFYRFSNRDSLLSDVWLIGGGANIEPLCEAIRSTLDLNVHPAWELIGAEGLENCCELVQAIGTAVE